MAAGQWWNIWTLASAQAEEIIPHTIQSATKPVQGGKSQWGQIYTVAGPYSSQAAAQQAIGQYHGPPPGSTGAGGAPNLLNWKLAGSGFAGWFNRALKILFGGILMIIGIGKLTGADNKIVQLAGKALPAAVLA